MISKRSTILAALAIAIAVLIAGIGALHTRPVRNYALDQIRDYLESEIGIELKAENLRYNLFTGSVSIENLRARALDSTDPILIAKQIAVDFGMLNLPLGVIRIESGLINEPNLRLVIDPSGRINIPKTAQPQEDGAAGAPPQFRIDSLEVADGAFSLADRVRNIGLELPRWSLSASGADTPAEHRFEIRTTSAGVLTSNGQSMPITEFSAGGTLQPDGATIETLDLRTSVLTASARGQLDNFSEPDFNADVDLTVNTGSAVEFLGLQEPLSGNIEVHAELSGAGGEVQAASTLRSSSLAYGEIANATLQIDSLWSSADQVLSIRSLELNSPAGRASIEGRMAMERAAQSEFEARLDRINLRTLTRQLKLPIRLASYASGTAEVRWPGLEFVQAAGTVRLRLSESRESPGENLVPVEGSLTAASEGNRMHITATDIRALGAQLNGVLTVLNRTNLEGKLSGNLPALNATLTGLNTVLEGPSEAAPYQGDLDGVVEVSATVGGTLSQPRGQAEIQGRGLRFGDVTGAELNIRAQYQQDQLLLPEAAMRWQGQTVSMEGGIGLQGDSPSLDLRLWAERVSIGDVLAGLGSELPVSGRATLSATALGTIADPRVSLELGASELAAYGEAFGSLAAQADWAGERIEVSRLRLDKPAVSGEAGYLEASGAFETESRQYTAAINGERITLEGLGLPGGPVVRGRIDIAANGEGSVEEPNLKGTLNASNLSIDERSVGALSTSFAVDGTAATLEAVAPEFNLTAKGSLEIAAPHQADIELLAVNTDLGQLGLTLQEGEPIAGSISAAVRASGPLDDWESGELRADITGLRASLGKHELRNVGEVQFAFADRRLQAGPVAVQFGDSRIDVEGEMPLDQNAAPGAVKIAGDLDLDELASLVPVEDPIAAVGRLSLNAALTGTFQRLTPTFDAKVSRAALYLPALRSPLTAINANVGLQGGALALENFQAEWAGADLSASGRLPLGTLVPEGLPIDLPRESGPAAATLDLTGFVIDSLPDLPRDLGGRLSLHIDAEAPQLEPEVIRANLRFDQLEFQYKAFELRQEAPATIALERGRGRIEQFALSGPDTKVRADGEVDLSGEMALNLRLEANTDAGILALASDDISARGPVSLKLGVTGSAESPEIEGALEISRGQAAVATPTLQLENLNARIGLQSDRIAIEQLSGTLNGGAFQATGDARLAEYRIEAVNADLSAENVYLDFPEGMRTISDAKLTVRPRDEAIVVGGGITINEGSYTEEVEFDQLLFDYFRAGGQTTFESDPDPLLSRLRFAVDVNTADPIILENNLAELAAEADLRLVGTYYRPGLTGRVQLREGGELYLSENRYFIDRGVIDFFNEARIEPTVDITARTEVRQYDIALQMSGGGPEPLSTTLTSPSHPELPEPDLISLLLTGRVREELRGEEINVAAEQSLSYLTGRIGSRLSRGAESTLGLSEVRIEPNLIAAESDPGARLTLGQNITDQLQLIYSTDLADSSNQIWIAQYDVTKRLMTQAIKQDDNSYRFDLRHDLQFGGTPAESRSPAQGRPKPLIGIVKFTGATEFSEQELIKILRIKPGKPFDFFALRRGADRLENRLAERGFLEARIQIERQAREDTVDLLVRIESGPRVEFVYEGREIPTGAQQKVRQRWREGIFDAQRAAESALAIRAYLAGEGYHDPKISHTVHDRPSGVKQVTFEIGPGPRSDRLELVFEGAAGIEASELKEQLQSSGLRKAVFSEPNQVVDFLTGYYQSNGYLDVSVERPEYRFDPATETGRAVIAIEEGPLYRVGEIIFQGNRAVAEPDLRLAAGISSQQPYQPDLLRDALVHIEERYWRDGYNDVEVNFNVTKNQRQGRVTIQVGIEENQKGVVRRVEVAGNRNTSENLVRSQLGLEPGDTLSFEEVGQARRKLYQTGAYSLVDIESDPLDPGQSGPGEKPLNLRVKVRELRPFQLRYGGFFDTERGPGVIADFTTRNILGSARVLGLRTRYDSEVREARAYVSQPLLNRFPIESTATTFLRREIEAGFITDRTGFTLNQETRWKETFVLNYGYRFERTHTFEREPDPLVPFDVRLNVAPLTATLSRETRDEILDATRGSFWSNAVEYAPSTLGSDLRFIKYFGQYYKYIPLGDPQPVPFQKRLLKPRFAYASGVRVGLARGLGGQVLIPSERFFAGGGTTIRGFAEDAVGPVDFEGAPTGGDAVFVLNNEIRFPLIGFFDGVGFVDLGNVYRSVSDFDPFNLRKSAGFGLRVRTPYFLLRADYGFKLDRLDGESAGAFFFSIGQAF